MTNEQIKRTIEALVETNRLLATEEAYPSHLQNDQSLTFLRAHKAKLEDMLRGPLAAIAA